MTQKTVGSRYRSGRVASRRCRVTAAMSLMVTVTLSGCSSGSDKGTSTVDNNASTPLAYITNASQSTGEFGLVRDGRIIAHRTGNFISINKPVWTLDGRYVATLDESTGSGQLVVINGGTGAMHTIPCSSCTTLAAISRSQLLVGLDPVGASANGDKSADLNDLNENVSMLQVDLSSKAPPIRVTTKLSKRAGAFEFLAGDSNETLVTTVPDLNQPEQLSLLRLDGSVQPLGSSQSSTLVGLPAAATTQTVNGRQVFALDGGWPQALPNEGGGNIFLLDAATGKHTYTDISVFAPPDQLPSSDIQIIVFDLWWDHASTLYATMALYVGDPHATGTLAYKIPPRLWRLDDNRWVQVSSDRALYVRQLDARTKAVIVPLKDGDGDGPLYIDVDGKRTHLMDHVSYISTPP